jgi:glyoxylase-like metal-dependent hydrolase (beta-lactamase superfamily II)
VLHTPGHTTGSVCLLHEADGLLFSGDTLFPGGWGRVDLPNGSPDLMAASIARLGGLEDAVRVLPGHGASTTIERERPWMDTVRRQGRLPF